MVTEPVRCHLEVAIHVRRRIVFHELRHAATAGLPLLRSGQQVVVEPGIVDEVAPGQRVVCVPGDDGVHALHAGDRLHERRAELGRTAVRVARVDVRQALAREHVARVHRACGPEDDERVAVGVAAPEIVQVDLIGTAEQRALGRERGLGQVFPILARERLAVLDRAAFEPGAVVTVLTRHVPRRVLVRHEVDRVGKLGVGAAVVPMRVRVDDGRHRLVGDRAHLGENVLAVAPDLRVDERHPRRHHENRGVPSGAHALLRGIGREHVEIVRKLQRADIEAGLARLVGDDGQQDAGQREDQQAVKASHVDLLGPGRACRTTRRRRRSRPFCVCRSPGTDSLVTGRQAIL